MLAEREAAASTAAPTSAATAATAVCRLKNRSSFPDCTSVIMIAKMTTMEMAPTYTRIWMMATSGELRSA